MKTFPEKIFSEPKMTDSKVLSDSPQPKLAEFAMQQKGMLTKSQSVVSLVTSKNYLSDR